MEHFAKTIIFLFVLSLSSTAVGQKAEVKETVFFSYGGAYLDPQNVRDRALAFVKTALDSKSLDDGSRDLIREALKGEKNAIDEMFQKLNSPDLRQAVFAAAVLIASDAKTSTLVPALRTELESFADQVEIPERTTLAEGDLPDYLGTADVSRLAPNKILAVMPIVISLGEDAAPLAETLRRFYGSENFHEVTWAIAATVSMRSEGIVLLDEVLSLIDAREEMKLTSTVNQSTLRHAALALGAMGPAIGNAGFDRLEQLLDGGIPTGVRQSAVIASINLGASAPKTIVDKIYELAETRGSKHPVDIPVAKATFRDERAAIIESYNVRPQNFVSSNVGFLFFEYLDFIGEDAAYFEPFALQLLESEFMDIRWYGAAIGQTIEAYGSDSLKEKTDLTIERNQKETLEIRLVSAERQLLNLYVEYQLPGIRTIESAGQDAPEELRNEAAAARSRNEKAIAEIEANPLNQQLHVDMELARAYAERQGIELEELLQQMQ